MSMISIDALHNFSIQAVVGWVYADALKAGASCNARHTDPAITSQQHLAGKNFGYTHAVFINLKSHVYGLWHPR